MRLSKLLKGLQYETNNFVDVDVAGISYNSKSVKHDFVFFALSDGTSDGRKHIPEAIQNGAKVVVCVSDGNFDKLNDKVVYIYVADVRFAMSMIARNFYGRADEKLKLIGVVGSNGKTTTSTIIYDIMRFSNKKVGLIGTNGVQFCDNYIDSGMTTPDPIELHLYLSKMLSCGVEYVVIEVSAHAIYYQKIAGIKFDIGVFTNISNEHLDFFGDMENYAHVKKSFFSANYVKECVVNIDDDLGMQIAYDSDIPCVSFGLTRPANIFAVDIMTSIDIMTFVVNAFDDILRIKTYLIGDYNVYNIMASIGVCRLLGLNDNTIVQNLTKIRSIDGRWQTFDCENDKKIIVDFAHTPDGFEKVMSLIKSLRHGKITTIFGCVGYSDVKKRTEMGEIASKYSDKIIVTTDNICNADFEDVVNDIIKNITCDFEVVEDRKNAISLAFSQIKSGETIVILGKGNERYQKIGNKKIPYSDIDVVKELLQNK